MTPDRLGLSRRAQVCSAVAVACFVAAACGSSGDAENRVSVKAAESCPAPQPPQAASGDGGTLQDQLESTRKWQVDQAASSRTSTPEGAAVTATVSYPRTRVLGSVESVLVGLPKGSRVTALYGGLDSATGGFYRSLMSTADTPGTDSRTIDRAKGEIKEQLASLVAGSRTMASNLSISAEERAAASRNADELEKLAVGIDTSGLPIFGAEIATTYSRSSVSSLERDGVVVAVAPSGCRPIEPIYPADAGESWVRLANSRSESTATKSPLAVDLPPTAVRPDSPVDPALLDEIANAPATKGAPR